MRTLDLLLDTALDLIYLGTLLGVLDFTQHKSVTELGDLDCEGGLAQLVRAVLFTN